LALRASPNDGVAAVIAAAVAATVDVFFRKSRRDDGRVVSDALGALLVSDTVFSFKPTGNESNLTEELPKVGNAHTIPPENSGF